MAGIKTKSGRREKPASERSIGVVTVKFKPELKKRIEAAADNDRRSVADWIRVLVQDRLAILECAGESSGNGAK